MSIHRSAAFASTSTRAATSSLRPTAFFSNPVAAPPFRPLHSSPFHRSSTMTEQRRSCFASSMQLRSFSAKLFDVIPFESPFALASSILGFGLLCAAVKYRNAIKKRMKILSEESFLFGAGITMERVLDSESDVMRNGVFQNLRLLELNPEFIQQHEDDERGNCPKMVNLGDYLSTLRPKQLPSGISVDDLPTVIQREIEAGLAASLLKALGPTLGLALLPTLGAGFVENTANKLGTRLATDWFVSDGGGISESNDKGGIPLNVMNLLAGADMNAKVNTGNAKEADAKDNARDKAVSTPLSPMEKMIQGEVVLGPSFADEESKHLMPNDFVVDDCFNHAIAGMETRLAGGDYGGAGGTALKMAQEEVLFQEATDTDNQDETQLDNESYDPEDLRLGEPKPVNPRLFPGLCLGYGDALNSHTKREVLKMRLLATLLNKLGSNYSKRVKGDSDDIFTVRMRASDAPIDTPWEFVQALIAAGHDIRVVPSSRMTTFGIGMCIKEEDDSYTSVPLGFFIESGYEDRHGRMAPLMLPHSGLDLYVKGPLAGHRADGTPSELAIQHFISIEGYCGWYQNSDPQVPFNGPVFGGDMLTGNDAVRAARIAGLYANVLNCLGTDLALPFGGYGLTAVCNDSAAIIQQILYGHVTIFPLTALGMYAQRTIRYAQNLRDDLSSLPAMEKEVEDLYAITKAMRQLPSDINASPANAHSAAERCLQTMQLPIAPFVLMQESQTVMESILEEEKAEEALLKLNLPAA